MSTSGDTGEGEESTEGQLIKESDHVYSLWSSGRQNCTGMLVQLKVDTLFNPHSPKVIVSICIWQFCRRHDLFSVLTSLFRPQSDTAVRNTHFTSDAMTRYTSC